MNSTPLPPSPLCEYDLFKKILCQICALLPVFSAPPVVPGTPNVTFVALRQQFTITWDEPQLNAIDAYYVNISGPNNLCGNDSVNIPLRVTERSYTCTIQTTPQEGETYTIRVAAANCGGNLRGPKSAPVRLQGIEGEKFVH